MKNCVVACLQEYIERTKSVRKENDKLLLLLCIKPFKPVSKDTVSRWMKTVLVQAGIHDFEPHSFEGAASTAMAQSGMSMEDMLKKAGWSNIKTFKRFYYHAESVEKEKTKSKDNKIVQYFFKRK